MEVLMKKRIKKHIIDLLKDESGQGTTEYILILVAVVVLALAFKTPMQTKINEMMTNLSGKITTFMQ